MSDLPVHHYIERREPVVLQAVQLTGTVDWEAVAEWCGGSVHLRAVQGEGFEPSDVIVFPTSPFPAIRYTARETDWVCRNVDEHGSFFRLGDEAFADGFEMAVEFAVPDGPEYGGERIGEAVAVPGRVEAGAEFPGGITREQADAIVGPSQYKGDAVTEGGDPLPESHAHLLPRAELLPDEEG